LTGVKLIRAFWPLALVLGLLALAFVLIADPAFPAFRLKSELKLLPVSPLAFPFHHEENIPVTIAAGDFNGDGRPDLIVGSVWNNEYSNQIALFAGKGDGTFAAPVVTRLNARPIEVQVADFNGDGISDVAVISRSQTPGGENRLRVLTGSKDGILKSAWMTRLDADPSALFIADFDGDGKLDLAVSANPYDFVVARGKGDGKFAEPVRVCQCTVSRVVDLNGDHLPDLVVHNQPYAAVRMNTGNGLFGPPRRIGRLEFGGRVGAADLNGDGFPDLIFFANPQTPGITIYSGNGDGTFHASGSLIPQEKVSAIRIADLNGDGFPDILATVERRNTGDLMVFRGVGKGTFGAPLTIRTGYSRSDIAIADFNLDRQPDVAVSSMGALSVSVFLQSR